jgi:hypothetical protein
VASNLKEDYRLLEETMPSEEDETFECVVHSYLFKEGLSRRSLDFLYFTADYTYLELCQPFK